MACIGIEVSKLVFFQLCNSLLEYLLVSIKANIIDKATLFAAEQVPCPTYLQVLHSDMDTATKVSKLGDGLHTFAGILW